MATLRTSTTEAVREASRSRTWRLPGAGFLTQITGMWVASRISLITLTLGFLFLHSYIGAGDLGSPLHALDRWDTRWYLQISERGYFSRDSANFFPLYPFLIGGLAQLLGAAANAVPGHDLRMLSALALANLGTLVAFVSLGYLSRDQEEGRQAVAALAAYPFAFFLSAGYTEGLFLGLATLSLLLARRGRWRAAWLTSFLAGLTRSTALILVLPLFIEFIEEEHGAALRSRWSGRPWRLPPGLLTRRLPLGIAAASGVPLALALHMTYLQVRFGDWLLFVHTQQSRWHHHFSLPWTTLGAALTHALSGSPGFEPVNLALVLAFGLLTLLGIQRLPASHTVYMASLLLLLLVSPTNQHDIIQSAGRYLLAGFPVFLLLGRWMTGRPWLQQLTLGGGFMLQAALAAIFLSGGPIY